MRGLNPPSASASDSASCFSVAMHVPLFFVSVAVAVAVFYYYYYCYYCYYTTHCSSSSPSPSSSSTTTHPPPPANQLLLLSYTYYCGARGAISSYTRDLSGKGLSNNHSPSASNALVRFTGAFPLLDSSATVPGGCTTSIDRCLKEAEPHHAASPIS